MAQLAKFTKPDWGPVYINPLTVRYLRAEKTTRGTMIVFDKEHLVSVSEDIETVSRELAEAVKQM
jgi:hypothetical protein